MPDIRKPLRSLTYDNDLLSHILIMAMKQQKRHRNVSMRGGDELWTAREIAYRYLDDDHEVVKCVNAAYHKNVIGA